MDQPFVMDPLDFKSGAPVRRDDDYLRQSGFDAKYGYPQNHLYPPSSSLRSLPKVPYYEETDPRYVPQDPVSSVRDMDEKRLRGYPTQAAGQTGQTLSSQNGQSTNFNTQNYHNYPGFTTTNLNNANLNNANVNNANVNNANNVTTNSSLNNVPASASNMNLMNGYLTYNMSVPMPVMAPVSVPYSAPRKRAASELVAPIPPLHVQQELAKDDEAKPETETIHSSKCSRCKKDFVQRSVKDAKGQADVKVYKLCQHCRDLQRERSRRWQMKTKDKGGACRRCGSDIPPEEQRYVLCPGCRKSLRNRKASRAASGRCVHCSGPIESSIIKNEETGERRANPLNFKVCERCRENDRIRRNNLERMGNCNRCARVLPPNEQFKHKVCSLCRQKKKKVGSVGPVEHTPAPGMGQLPDLAPVAPVYLPGDQMIMSTSMSGSISNNMTNMSTNMANMSNMSNMGMAHDYNMAYAPVQMPQGLPVPSDQMYSMQRRGYSK